MSALATTDAPETTNDPTPAGAWARVIGATAARALLFSALAMAFWAWAPAIIGWTPTTVMSDSMAPAIRAGDVVVSRPIATDELTLGQILLFEDPDHTDRLRLHRFHDVDEDGRLVMKGDANAQPDSSTVTPDEVRGIGFIRIPLIGLPIVWLREGQWRAFACIVAAIGALLVLSRADRGVRQRSLGRSSAGGRRVTPFLTLVAVPVAAAIGVAAISIPAASYAAFSAVTANPASSFASTAYDCLNRAPIAAAYLYYGYSEASGTSAADSSGNNRTGTLTGGVTRDPGSCAAGGSPAITLNGSNGQVVTPGSAITAPTTYSIETWFRTTTTQGGKLIGFGNAQSGASTKYDRHLYMTNAGQVLFGVHSSVGFSNTVPSPGALNDGRWHHAVATYGGSTLTLYIDGASVGTFFTLFPESNSGWWRIGGDSLSGWPSAPTSNYFQGQLDGTAVYTTALSASQVAQSYARGH